MWSPLLLYDIDNLFSLFEHEGSGAKMEKCQTEKGNLLSLYWDRSMVCLFFFQGFFLFQASGVFCFFFPFVFYSFSFFFFDYRYIDQLVLMPKQRPCLQSVTKSNTCVTLISSVTKSTRYDITLLFQLTEMKSKMYRLKFTQLSVIRRINVNGTSALSH